MATEIKTTNGHTVIVDDADFDYLNQFSWSAVCPNPHTFYAQRNKQIAKGKFVTSLMHRELLNAPKGFQVDHIDSNGLNNQRKNLRVCTHSQNQRNQVKRRGKSKFKGVYLNSKLGRWYAQIKLNGKSTHLGMFELEIDAARAYDKAAKNNFGEFASVNGV